MEVVERERQRALGRKRLQQLRDGTANPLLDDLRRRIGRVAVRPRGRCENEAERLDQLGRALPHEALELLGERPRHPRRIQRSLASSPSHSRSRARNGQ